MVYRAIPQLPVQLAEVIERRTFAEIAEDLTGVPQLCRCRAWTDSEICYESPKCKCDEESDDATTTCDASNADYASSCESGEDSDSDCDLEVIEANLPVCEPPGEWDHKTEVSVHARTTLMMHNLPECWKRSDLCNWLNSQGFREEYDFLYLPTKLRGGARCGSAFGYAFANFISHASADNAMERLNGLENEGRICQVVWSSRQQSCEGQVERYRNSPIMHSSVDDEFKPAVYQGGVRFSFPPPYRKLCAPRFKRNMLRNLPNRR